MKYLIFAILLLVVTGCAQQVDVSQCVTEQEAGFFTGWIQGFILPIALIVSWFDSDVAIYAVNNSGGWYDLGYYFGIATIIGGGSHINTKYIRN